MTAHAADALPQTCCPSVWLWPGHALYAGPSLKLAPHSGSVWCFAVGIGGPLTVTSRHTGRVDGHSVLIPPRLTHQLTGHGTGLVSCYLEPASSRAARCRAKASRWHGVVGSGHVDEERLQISPADDESAARWLALAAPPADRRVDPRIAHAANLIRDAGSLASRELAAEVGLSESRFLHLFRDEMGTTVRRYRLWLRLMNAGGAIAEGKTLTDAAMQSGFASPSHLSDRFKSTFGLSASDLLAAGVVVRVPNELTVAN